MKKLNYLFLGLAGLALASCSQEDVVAPGVSDGNYTLKVKLPADLATRAGMSDGLKADLLYMAVYDADENNRLVFQDLDSYRFDNSLETTVSLDLSTGKQYTIVFFAQSSQAQGQAPGIYDFNAGAGTLTVDYDLMTGAVNNGDYYDCFFRSFETGVIGTATQPETIELYRPIAQINWGTDDLDEPAIASNFGIDGSYIRSTLSTKAYNVLNFFTSDVESGMVDVVLGENPEAVPPTPGWEAPTTEVFPVKGYDYIAMQYLLAPRENSALYDLTLTVSNAGKEGAKVTQHDIIVTSAPVQANYRTNIFGQLLSDNVTFEVVKDPEWEKPDYEINIGAWDGQSYKLPNVVGDTYQINGPEDLYGLYLLGTYPNWNSNNEFGVPGESAGTQQYVNKKIQLNADIDLGGHQFPCIGYTEFENGMVFKEVNVFQGEFDGNGHTISNFTVVPAEGTPSSVSFGVFGSLGYAGSVKNVNFDNVTIKAPSGAFCTGAIGYAINNTIENVNVLGGKITGNDNVGGIVGLFISTGSGYNIVNCSNNAAVSGNSMVGGIMGIGVGGGGNGAIDNCVNTGSVSATGSSIGGIAGEMRWGGTIKNSRNEANVSGPTSGTDAGLGVGGIVGWIRNLEGYNSRVPTGYGGPVAATGNTNKGNVSGASGVGGIVGQWYYGGLCSGNVNEAGEISATDAAASIVGYSILADKPAGGDNGGIKDPKNLQITGNSSTTTKITGAQAWTLVTIGGEPGTTQADVTLEGNTPAENERIQ